MEQKFQASRKLVAKNKGMETILKKVHHDGYATSLYNKCAFLVKTLFMNQLLTLYGSIFLQEWRVRPIYPPTTLFLNIWLEFSHVVLMLFAEEHLRPKKRTSILSST